MTADGDPDRLRPSHGGNSSRITPARASRGPPAGGEHPDADYRIVAPLLALDTGRRRTVQYVSDLVVPAIPSRSVAPGSIHQ